VTGATNCKSTGELLVRAGAIDDAEEVAGMLIGMVASAPQRAAIYGGLPLPSRKQVERRVRTCAALFLDGCRMKPT